MPAFKISDRVRVRATSATTGLAGRVGAVVLVNRKSDRKPSVFYVVRLDDPPNPPAHAVFGPDDLEPEASGTP